MLTTWCEKISPSHLILYNVINQTEFYLAGFSTQALAVTDTVDTDEKALASNELRKMIGKG